MDKMKVYHKIMEFAKNKNPNGGFGNLYFMQLKDLDGNITNEAYGMNMITEYGFIQYFGNVTAWPSNTGSLFIGDGEFNARTSLIGESGTSHTLTHTSMETPLTWIDTTDELDVGYPMYHYPIEGSNDNIVTCVAKFRTYQYDYNVPGVTGNFSITEYGIGSDISHLWTHSWAYNINGSPTTIVKHPNEELTVTVFLCMSYKTSIIDQARQNGVYPVITTLSRFMGKNANDNNNYHAMQEKYLFTYGRNHSYVDRNDKTSSHRSAILNHSQTFTRALTSFTLQNTAAEDQGYIDGFVSWTNGFVIVEPQYLEEENAEAFSVEIKGTFDDIHPSDISKCFGRKSEPQIPITQLSMKTGDGLHLYDKYAGSYSNPLAYTNDSNHWYTESTMQKGAHAQIYVTDINDAIIPLYVYQNMHPEDPIHHFDNTDIATIYATDKYWDYSSYIQIRNYELPQNVTNKKYYITNTYESSLEPVRTTKPFTTIPSVGKNATYSYDLWNRNLEQNAYSYCENYDAGYYVKNNTIFIPSKISTHTINMSRDLSIQSVNASGKLYQHFCYGDLLVTIAPTSGVDLGKIIITTISASLDSTTSVEYYLTDPSNGFTTDFDIYDTYRTESGTGIIVFQSITTDECVVLDLTRNDPGSPVAYRKRMYPSKMACAIWDGRTTNAKQRFAYLTSDGTAVKVCDVSTNTETTLGLPMSGSTPLTDFVMMWGLNDQLYASNGSTWTWHWDLSTGNTSGENCQNIMTLLSQKSKLSNVRFTGVKDVNLMYLINDNNLSNAWYVRDDKDKNVTFFLSAFAKNWGTFAGYLNDGLTYYALKYIENGKTLALICDYHLSSWNGGTIRGIIDLGPYLNPPTGKSPIYSKAYFIAECANSNYNTEPYYPAWMPYGENLIWGQEQVPITLMMPMQLTGHTRTISSINHVKNISNKTFDVDYTNVAPSEWGTGNGYPLGTKN